MLSMSLGSEGVDSFKRAGFESFHEVCVPVQRAEARVSAVSPEAGRLAFPYAAMGTRNGEKSEQESACCVVTSAPS